MRLELAGQEFGELTAIEPAGATRLGVVWRCTCRCGAEQLRRAAALMHARRNNITPMCPRCLGEWRRGAGIDRRSRQREAGAMRPELQLYGLYALRYDSQEEEALTELIASKLGVGTDQATLAESEGESDLHVESGERSLGQDWSQLFPLHSGEDAIFECSLCQRPNKRGWGCTGCVRFVCVDCGRAEKHRSCWDDTSKDGLPFRAIGEHLEVSMERARQIASKAMRKVERELYEAEKRSKSRAKTLCFPSCWGSSWRASNSGRDFANPGLEATKTSAWWW